MYQALLTDNFESWLHSLKDSTTRLRLTRRLEKAEQGNLGDTKPVGSNVYEMREFFGPGWRMYFYQNEDKIIVMLGGGGKPTQNKDIQKAIQLANNLR